jgi:hypothetical protein
MKTSGLDTFAKLRNEGGALDVEGCPSRSVARRRARAGDRDRGEPRVVVRPDSATCASARVGDGAPHGIRAHAAPRRTDRLARVGATAAARTGEAARRGASAPLAQQIANCRCRAARGLDPTRARLLDPDGTRADATQRRQTRSARAGATGRGEAGEPLSRREAIGGVSNCVRRAIAASRA